MLAVEGSLQGGSSVFRINLSTPVIPIFLRGPFGSHSQGSSMAALDSWDFTSSLLMNKWTMFYRPLPSARDKISSSVPAYHLGLSFLLLSGICVYFFLAFHGNGFARENVPMTFYPALLYVYSGRRASHFFSSVTPLYERPVKE
jgi:hypothetical protein